MKLTHNIKLFLFFILISEIFTVNAITFNTKSLKDNNSSNYIGFTRENSELNDSYEKVTADFNGDGFNDILSIGGIIECHLCSPPPPPNPMELLLYNEGEFIYHKININYSGRFVNVIDIDHDNDIDIILSNGNIALNDGNANFTLSLYSEHSLDNQLFSVDWNQDGNLDIINKDSIFINDGQLNFTESTNNIANGNPLIIADLNNDLIIDMLVINEGKLESWIQDGSAQFSLNSTYPLEYNFSKIKSIDVNSDNSQDLIIAFNTGSGMNLQLLINDGEGQFSLSVFDFSQIEDLQYDEIEIAQILIEDADNDGDDDLWINTLFTNGNAECSNKQNLVLIYENINDGNIEYKRSLHSIGYNEEAFSLISEPETQFFITLVDLNHDKRLEVVMPGEKPVSWINNDGYYFNLSNASSLQFNNHIQAVDFNADGNADILSSGKYIGSCQSIPVTSEITSITNYYAGGKLWLGDGNGKFEPYSTGIAGFTTFNGPSEYSKLVDLFQDGNLISINTVPQNNDGPRHTTIAYPRLADPGIYGNLPEPTKLIETADLTNNGNLELVMLADTQEAAIYVMGVPSNSPLPTQVIAKLDFGFREGEILLEDMDGDGFIDIVTNSKAVTNAVTIWYNNGNGTFDASSAFANDVKAIAISDFNRDGKKDIFSSNLEHEIWINHGERIFKNIDYDSIFWKLQTRIEPDDFIDLIPEKVSVIDINGDGLDDLTAYIQGNVSVYMNNSKDGISFYKNYSNRVVNSTNSNLLENSNLAFADFNNDGLMDFASGSDNFIKLNLQTHENLSSGLYYDPSHNGHGFSVEELTIENLYYSVFYTYDVNGNPDWYAILNRYEADENIWQLSRTDNNYNIHFLYDYNSRSTMIDNSSTNKGWFDFYNSNGTTAIDNAFVRIGSMPNSWSINEIILSDQKPENDLSGIWWAGFEDAGWGISLSFVHRENTQEVVVVLYFYDELGQPRWLIGQSMGFELDQDLVVNMKKINGYGRFQNHVELTEMDSGTITLNLRQASTDLNEAGVLSMDIHYPDDEFNNNWTRSNIPFALFSKPRN